MTERQRAWSRWNRMMQRFYDPDAQLYDVHGGAGGSVAERWHDFDAYWSDTGVPPDPDKPTVVRVDPSKPLGPENWAWGKLRYTKRIFEPGGSTIMLDGKRITAVEAARLLDRTPASFRVLLYRSRKKGDSRLELGRITVLHPVTRPTKKSP